jgi:hypothetical protein
VTLNPNWGGVTESNAFGTHEFMDFLDQVGAEAFISVNVGTGTPQEAAEWLEYLTAAQPTKLAGELERYMTAFWPSRYTSSFSESGAGTAQLPSRESER